MVLSKRVDNDESALLDLIAAVLVAADGDAVVWATDLNTGGPAPLLALLEAHGQQVLYTLGRIIADQARMRRDHQPVRGTDQISTDLRLLTSHRTDLIYDRVRLVNRLRASTTGGSRSSPRLSRPYWHFRVVSHAPAR